MSINTLFYIHFSLFIIRLPTAKITNPDVTRLINSTEIQSVVRPANAKIQKRPWTQKKNPLVNKGVLFRLNPYAKVLRRQELRTYPWPRIHFRADTHHSRVQSVKYKRKRRKRRPGLLQAKHSLPHSLPLEVAFPPAIL